MTWRRYAGPERYAAQVLARRSAVLMASAGTVRRWSETLNRYVALLRAVNVGGTGKLPMTALAQMCEAAGLKDVKTYIASGNVVFRSESREDQVRCRLEDQLREYSGRDVGVIVRTGDEIVDTISRIPSRTCPVTGSWCCS